MKSREELLKEAIERQNKMIQKAHEIRREFEEKRAREVEETLRRERLAGR